MFAEALKRAQGFQQPQMQGFQQMMPQFQQMQMPQLDMFGQSNNSGALAQALRGMQWPGRI